jgi:hypothetical protein
MDGCRQDFGKHVKFSKFLRFCKQKNGLAGSRDAD